MKEKRMETVLKFHRGAQTAIPDEVIEGAGVADGESFVVEVRPAIEWPPRTREASPEDLALIDSLGPDDGTLYEGRTFVEAAEKAVAARRGRGG
jgi:hypothetical protein